MIVQDQRRVDSPLHGRSLVLVGYRATGKSTVGRLLANRLGCPFVDTDRQIEAVSGRSIPEIFATDGEESFRDWEQQIIAQITGQPGPIQVVATGGGSILRQANRMALRRFGFVIWLKADPQILARRLHRNARNAGVDQRPALTSRGTVEEVEEVLAFRLPLYRKVSHLVIDTTHRSSSDVAHDLAMLWLQSQ